MTQERTWTVGPAAEAVGTTVRALHHYDAIGLVVPGGRTEAGYRVYTGTDLDRLRVLRSGAAVPGPAELMAAPRWTSLLAGLCAAFDLVVIDSPAVLPVGDTLELVRSADLTLLVARGDVSRKDDLAAAVERIEQVGGTVGGVVVCDLSKAAMSASAPR